MKWVPKVALLLGSFSATILSCEFMAGWLVLPSWVAHPPNHVEIRHNLEFEYEFRTNSVGLRSTEIPLKPPPGRNRILVLGDSFVEGVGVQAPDAFVSLLERRYASHGVDFINGGLSGTGPTHYADLLLGVGRRYRPTGLLLVLYANDLVNMPPKTKHLRLRRLAWRLLPNLSALIRSRRPSPPPSEWLETAIARARNQGVNESRIARWRESLPPDALQAASEGRFNATLLVSGLLQPDYWTSSLDIDTPIANSRWEAMAAELDAILGTCRRKAIAVAVVFIPVVFQYDPRSHASENPCIRAGVEVRRRWLWSNSEVQSRLVRWAAREEVPLLDLTPALRRETSRGRRLTWRLDPHFTPDGHRFAAQEIGAWLDRQRVFLFLHGDF